MVSEHLLQNRTRLIPASTEVRASGETLAAINCQKSTRGVRRPDWAGKVAAAERRGCDHEPCAWFVHRQCRPLLATGEQPQVPAHAVSFAGLGLEAADRHSGRYFKPAFAGSDKS